jgi:radical SAM protein with 4Fe4S-binding SPASM domain
MKYFLSRESVLKWLETPSVYHIKKDDLYELDDSSFEFLQRCASSTGCDTEDSDFIDYCLEERILTRDKVLLKRPAVIKSPRPSLRYLELQITNKCNLRCRHCYIGDTTFSELLVTQIRDILKEFENMQGLRVLITGGEPLIHSGFPEINDMLPDFLFRKVLFTNGLLLNKKILIHLNVDEIQISIDGLEQAHDALRGKGSFRSAIKAAELAVSCGFEVSVSTMVHQRNLGDFDGMEKLFYGMGIKDWTVDVPCATGRLKENAGFQISPETGGKYLGYGRGGGLHSGASGFACGLHLMAVMADSRVAKCTFYADSFVGSIEDGLRECWERIKPIKLDKLACDCQYIESCRGGCRYRALLLGDPLGKDLYKCYLYDIIHKKE